MESLNKIIKNMQDGNYPSMPDLVRIKIPDAEKLLRGGLDFMVARFSGRRITKAIWNENNYRPIVDWMQDNEGKGLLMTGSCGLGKSLIGIRILPCLINHVHHKVLNCCDAKDMNAKADELMRYHLLSLDDVGNENIANDYGNKRMVFPELVDEAEKKGNLLVISTNQNIPELQQKYGDRTIDRLRAITKFVPFTGKSLRG